MSVEYLTFQKVTHEETKATTKRLEHQLNRRDVNAPAVKGKKAILCSDLTIISDGLGDFISRLGKSVNSVGNIAGKQILHDPAKAIELAAARSTAATTKKPRSCAETAYQVLEFTGQGTGSYLGEIK